MNFQEKLQSLQTLKTKAIEMEEKNEVPEIPSKTLNLMEMTLRNLNGDYSIGRADIQETLTTTDAAKLIPKVIEGKLREAAEPEYLGTRYMNKIKVEGNASTVYVIPIAGELVASEVAEGGRYNEDYVDYSTIENNALEVRVKKIGLKVNITEEAVQDSSWDVLGINIRKMGRAMARYKEEWIFENFSNHGHIIFDNNMRKQLPESGTTGRAADGSFNDTLSVEDFLDMVLALMGNGFNPTNLIMHPLTWVIFARNAMIGNGLSFGALGGSQVHPWGAVQGTGGFAGLSANGDGQKLIMKPEQVQNRLPVPLQVDFSPFVKFDKVEKRFDMYCIDRNEVGVIVQKEEMSTGQWNDPERDIRSLKVKERYGVGIINNGRAITVSRNLAVAPSHPLPPTVRVQTEDVK